LLYPLDGRLLFPLLIQSLLLRRLRPQPVPARVYRHLHRGRAVAPLPHPRGRLSYWVMDSALFLDSHSMFETSILDEVPSLLFYVSSHIRRRGGQEGLCERKLTPGVYLRDLSFQRLCRHVDSIVIFQKKGNK
jgi:hypothetical protein